MAVRAFIAVQLDPASHQQAARLLERLPQQAGAPRARWESAPNLHLTLRFLGDVDEALVPEITTVLRAALGSTPAPALRLGALGAFPSLDAARVIFAEVGDGGRLGAMEHALRDDLRRLGFPPERRPYVPHLTLARCKTSSDVRAWVTSLGPLEPIEARGEAVALFRSVTSPSGAVYQVLDRVPLVAG